MTDHPPAADVRAELDRILASDIFTRSERLSAYLRFIVERTLDGEGDTLKEQILAIGLYGRTADFNTAADPIVRVDASTCFTFATETSWPNASMSRPGA